MAATLRSIWIRKEFHSLGVYFYFYFYLFCSILLNGVVGLLMKVVTSLNFLIENKWRRKWGIRSQYWTTHWKWKNKFVFYIHFIHSNPHTYCHVQTHTHTCTYKHNTHTYMSAVTYKRIHSCTHTHTHPHTMRRLSQCDDYHRRKWNRWPEFKS